MRGFRAILVLVILFSQCVSVYAGAEVSLDALAMIESSNNPRAINRDEGSYGLFQISPIALRDFNERVGVRHTVKDLLVETTNAHIAIWMLEVRIPELLRYYKKPVNTRSILISYNCGITCLDRKELPKTTKDYLTKYRRLTGETL